MFGQPSGVITRPWLHLEVYFLIFMQKKKKATNFRNRCSQRKCQPLADGEDQASERAPLESRSQLPCVTISLQLDPISEPTLSYKTLKMGVSSEQPRRADLGQLQAELTLLPFYS